MIVPTHYDEKCILLADDEPEHIEWLADYLKGRGFTVQIVVNVKDAIEAVSQKKFRAYIIDLNIPLAGWVPHAKAKSAYNQYQGLHIIQTVRTQGNPGIRVIAYSAHFNEQITTEIKSLYCEYVVKGRARELKQLLETVLKTQPKS
jgi:CheY-like chemotaxis protein